MRDTWERIRRNPAYLALCEKAIFDEEGLVDLECASKFKDVLSHIFSFTRSLGLTTLVDPSRDFENIPPCCFDVYLDTRETVLPKMEPGSNGPIYRMRHGRFASFDIDITKSDSEIKEKLFAWLEKLRNERPVQTGEEQEGIKTKYRCYEVWDQRRGRKSITEIAEDHRENSEESLGRAIARIKRQFHRAFELIMGYPFDPTQFRRLVEQVERAGLSVPCDHCGEFECRKAMKEGLNLYPCPDYLQAASPYLTRPPVKPVQSSEDDRPIPHGKVVEDLIRKSDVSLASLQKSHDGIAGPKDF